MFLSSSVNSDVIVLGSEIFWFSIFRVSASVKGTLLDLIFHDLSVDIFLVSWGQKTMFSLKSSSLGQQIFGLLY